jgi:hypothetical protein
VLTQRECWRSTNEQSSIREKGYLGDFLLCVVRPSLVRHLAYCNRLGIYRENCCVNNSLIIIGLLVVLLSLSKVRCLKTSFRAASNKFNVNRNHLELFYQVQSTPSAPSSLLPIRYSLSIQFLSEGPTLFYVRFRDHFHSRNHIFRP